MRSAALDAVLSEFSTLVVPASRLEKPAVPTVPFGVTAVDDLTGGLPRGCLTEICGPASSGRTTLLLAALAGATQRGEVCALVDASDAFDPLSAEQAGVDLEKLLWVRCSGQRAASSEQNPPQRYRGTEKIGSSGDGFIGSSQPGRRDFKSEISNQDSEVEALYLARAGERPSAVVARKEKETRFVNSGMKNCGSRGVHTRLYSGMPAIPEVNVLTRPEQRYRDIDKLKQGDYSEPGKIPPQSDRGTERLGKTNTPIHTDSKSEFRNQKSEIQFWDLGLAHRLSATSRAELARIEQALKVTDLLLQSGGFGLIALDLGDVTVRNARRVPLTSWFRFRRAVENTATVLLVLEREAHARSCASLVLQLSAASPWQSAKSKPNHGFTRIDTDLKSEIRIQNSELSPSHSELLTGLDSHAEVARGERKKPAGSVRAEFTSQSAWSA